jgi:hypothetical protein
MLCLWLPLWIATHGSPFWFSFPSPDSRVSTGRFGACPNFLLLAFIPFMLVHQPWSSLISAHIFIHQAKHMKDLMKKFNMAELKSVSTPMSTTVALDPDENGKVVDQREYRSMIGSLLYLTVTRPNIQFVVCLCTHFQASPCSSHRTAVRWIFRYLKHTHEFKVWYSASSSFDFVGFFDANFMGCEIDRKSTSATYHFLVSSLACWSARKQSSIALSTIEAGHVAAALRYFG